MLTERACIFMSRHSDKNLVSVSPPLILPRVLISEDSVSGIHTRAVCKLIIISWGVGREGSWRTAPVCTSSLPSTQDLSQPSLTEHTGYMIHRESLWSNQSRRSKLSQEKKKKKNKERDSKGERIGAFPPQELQGDFTRPTPFVHASNAGAFTGPNGVFTPGYSQWGSRMIGQTQTKTV